MPPKPKQPVEPEPTAEQDLTKITIVLKGEDLAAFKRVRARLAPYSEDRFPSTEVLCHCLRLADHSESLAIPSTPPIPAKHV
jgi:hypothetical protein